MMVVIPLLDLIELVLQLALEVVKPNANCSDLGLHVLLFPHVLNLRRFESCDSCCQDREVLDLGRTFGGT